ncbi:MAG: hypothetical protein ACI9JN_000940 [Bacteroidia bacterium]|jgi:hypothetical protein
MFDTTEYKKDLSYYQPGSDIENLNFSKLEEDTSLQFGHHLLGSFIDQPIYLGTGRVAGPAVTLELQLPETANFQISKPLFKSWFYQSDSIPYHHSETARTDLSYAQGTGNLLQLIAEHSQNIAPNWSFGLQYNRTKSHNLYFNNLPLFNQQRMTNLFSTSVYSHFFSKNRKYEVLASFINSKNTVSETFGVENPVSFDQLSGRAKTYSGQAYLDNAENLTINREWSVSQFFRPGKRTIQINDSTTGADTNTENIHTQWFHQVKYTRQINRFIDDNPDTSLYPIRFIDLLTHDSTFLSVLQNRIGKVHKVKNGLVKYWIMHEAISVKQQYYHSSSFSHVRLAGEIINRTEKLHQHGYAHFSALGYNAGDFKALYKLEPVFKSTQYELTGTIINRRPDYNDQFFGSNYYYWNKPLDKTLTADLKLGVSNVKKTRQLQVTYRNIGQYVYYDTNGYAQQMSTSINYISAMGIAKINIGRSWHLNQRLTFQQSSSDNLPLPMISSKTRLYKEGFLFRKNMWARIGVDVQYFSPFTGLTYNPVVRQMTLSSSEIGGFPMIDIFINTQVKSMELYVSSHHVGQGYFINDSFLAANYPLIGRSIQFGVNWRLFD